MLVKSNAPDTSSSAKYRNSETESASVFHSLKIIGVSICVI